MLREETRVSALLVQPPILPPPCALPVTTYACARAVLRVMHDSRPAHDVPLETALVVETPELGISIVLRVDPHARLGLLFAVLHVQVVPSYTRRISPVHRGEGEGFGSWLPTTALGRCCAPHHACTNPIPAEFALDQEPVHGCGLGVREHRHGSFATENRRNERPRSSSAILD